MNIETHWVFTKCPKSLREAVCVHAFLMGLGYKKDEIFLVLTPTGVCVILKAEGIEVPLIRVGSPEFESGKMTELWRLLCRDWNKGGTLTKEHVDLLWQRSKIRHLKAVITSVLLGSGLTRGLDSIDPIWN